jgi:hypothetical protein
MPESDLWPLGGAKTERFGIGGTRSNPGSKAGNSQNSMPIYRTNLIRAGESFSGLDSLARICAIMASIRELV